LPELNVMLLTTPLAFGAHDVIVNGAVAEKLKALFRLNVWLPCSMIENLPTAYIVPPH